MCEAMVPRTPGLCSAHSSSTSLGRPANPQGSTNLVHVLQAHVPLIGKENVQRLLVRERLSRKAYLLADEKKKSKFRKFKAYPPGYLHIDIKYLPEARQTTPLPFCGHQAATPDSPPSVSTPDRGPNRP